MERYPLRVEAHRDEGLSRWRWLVKWLLLIPHILALLVLWTGLLVLTVVAYLAVLFTGRYPASIRTYNLGVLRWTWRVNYYGYQVLGTDRYPPFTLADVPDYPARLRLDDPPQPPRWLPLVAWLFAIPHLIILGALTGAAWTLDDNTRTDAPISVLAAMLLVAALALLFTGRYPAGLYHALVGIARWNLRVAAYIVLLVPRYPPLRLDQGDTEPDPAPDPPPAYAPATQVSAAGSITALIAGVLLLAPAAGLTIGGGVLLGLEHSRDRAGYVTSPTLQVASTTAAVTAENLTIAESGQWARTVTDVGGLRLTVTSPTGKPVFVGIAPQSAVDAWLAGVAHDELTGIPAGQARYDRAAGAVRQVADPAAQPFWVARTVGPGVATVQWNVVDGQYAVVVANADGSAGVTADVLAALQVPELTALGTGILTAGILLGLLAITLIVLGGTGLGRRHGGSPPPPPQAGPVGPVPEHVPPVPVGS
jgi:uncharacterized protein DUF4389